ncbi:hypothetical protein [Phenylobacterium sp.]|nr:hypothetical protein [Phenylobacterium sp.]MDP3869343.1 hypothetical protein [Phenylobacterium sp.]
MNVVLAIVGPVLIVAGVIGLYLALRRARERSDDPQQAPGPDV